MSTTPKPPSPKELESLRSYRFDTVNGEVFGPSGKSVGTIAGDGYVRVSITSENGQRGFRRCHLIFWAKNGRWPTSELDHLNRNQLDDSVDNLVESDRVKNGSNREICHQRALPIGVYHRPRMKSKPYAAVHKGKHIGLYATPEEASAAYQKEASGE